jgi:hypothetical protein
MQGPADGTLIYGVRLIGNSWFEMTESLQEALRIAPFAQEVREFWQL